MDKLKKDQIAVAQYVVDEFTKCHSLKVTDVAETGKPLEVLITLEDGRQHTFNGKLGFDILHPETINLPKEN
jgi:hypothetical protein